MGYEIAGALGVKLCAPDREVFAMVGDGSWLMLAQEIVTALQENVKLVVVLIDNGGFASIGGLSRSLGGGGFGTRYRARGEDGQLSGPSLRVDFAGNARSLGAHVIATRTIAELEAALAEARRQPRTTVVTIETDPEARVPGYEAWWDVPPAAVSTSEAVQRARADWEEARRRERWFL
jgi:3D-(3,5/4)-trihydroxycyclohexane-1,2-dione acylhydrolase (decyclizing)